MSERIRIPFQFHLRSVTCVSPEEAARLTQSNGVRLGPNDQHIPIEQLDLHRTPELDRIIRDARRAYAKQRAAEASRASLRSTLANAAFRPQDIPPGASGPARALYRNILPSPSEHGPEQQNADTAGARLSAGRASGPTTAEVQSATGSDLSRSLLAGLDFPGDAGRASATPQIRYAANDKSITNPVTGLPEKPLGEGQPLQSSAEEELKADTSVVPFGSGALGNVSSALTSVIGQRGESSPKGTDKDPQASKLSQPGLIQLDRTPDNPFAATPSFASRFQGSPEEGAVADAIAKIGNGDYPLRKHLRAKDHAVQLPGGRKTLYAIYGIGNFGRIAHLPGTSTYYYSPNHYKPTSEVPNGWIAIGYGDKQ